MVCLSSAGRLGVRRLTGQAASSCAWALHWLATLAVTLAVLASVAVAVIAWRLSEGPLDLSWFTGRLEDSANADGGSRRLVIGSAALAWEGFRKGVERPLDLRLTDVEVLDEAGGRLMNIPRAEVSLSLYELLLGRIVPRAVELDAPQLTLIRTEDGALSLDLGSLVAAPDGSDRGPSGRVTPAADLLAELARPPGNDRARSANALLGQLRRVRIHDARVAVVDRQLGITWRAPHAEIDFTRRGEGGMDGMGELSLAFGEQQARLSVSATLAAGASETHLRVRLSPVTPSVIARAAPSLGALAVLDAPVGGEARIDLDAGFTLRDARIVLNAGAGTIRIGGSGVRFLGASLALAGTPTAINLEMLRVSVRGHDSGPITHLETHGTVERRPGQITAQLSADLDQLEFADLAQLWPEGIGGGARPWLVANIPVGVAHNGHVDVGLAASPDGSAVALTSAKGELDGEGLQVHWLRPVPPIVNGQAQLHILDPDQLEITITGGRQSSRNSKESSGTGLQIRSGRMRISGIMEPHQIGTIEADIVGSLNDAVALLREPRLELLDRHPLELKNPTGQVTQKLRITVPLENAVQIDDIPVEAQAHLEGVHLSALVGGQDLDQGAFDLHANNDGMKLNGRALLASIPTKLEAAMDFRAGPPTQVLEIVSASAQPDARQLAAAGLDATSVMSGPVQMQVVLSQRRNGQGDVAVSADLTAAELSVTALEWRKAHEAPAKGSARMLLDHDRIIAIDGVQLDGVGLLLRGRAQFSGGSLSVLRVDRLALGRSVAQGTVEFSTTGSIAINLSSVTLDLEPRLARASSRQTSSRTSGSTPGTGEPAAGASWTLDAKVDRILLAHDGTASDVKLHAENDGRMIRQLRIEGHVGTHAPFTVQLVPARPGRRLTMKADDAGELLRGLDLVQSMQGGQLTVQADYDDSQPDRPLVGTAEIEHFRIRNAPAFAKLLKAMTLYGLVEVIQGPGLGFTRLVAPFRLTDDVIELTDARAFSPSLGLTMKGRLELDADRIDMQGTIVPAYFFNSLLGTIPLVGKLFSPELGGGVFAASYTVRGRLGDPEVSVNPLAALTPGFLRGLFKLF
jgi:hypothetical protein